MTDDKHSNQFQQGKERLDEIGRRLGGMFGGKGKDSQAADKGGFFSGLGSLVEQLGALVEQAEKAGAVVNSSGRVNFGSAPKRKGVYGFTVKSAVGDAAPKVESFGNIRRGDDGKLVAVHEVREPMVDVFDEPTRLLIVAEVPGVEAANVQLEIHDDILLISIEKGEPKYRREVLLPAIYTPGQMSFQCRNGVLEIQLLKH
jgi:HSP20 family protein